jgi:hypothetical protein
VQEQLGDSGASLGLELPLAFVCCWEELASGFCVSIEWTYVRESDIP